MKNKIVNFFSLGIVPTILFLAIVALQDPPFI